MRGLSSNASRQYRTFHIAKFMESFPSWRIPGHLASALCVADLRARWNVKYHAFGTVASWTRLFTTSLQREVDQSLMSLMSMRNEIILRSQEHNEGMDRGYADEVRIDAWDGGHYTMAEFVQCYGGLAEWYAAAEVHYGEPLYGEGRGRSHHEVTDEPLYDEVSSLLGRPSLDITAAAFTPAAPPPVETMVAPAAYAIKAPEMTLKSTAPTFTPQQRAPAPPTGQQPFDPPAKGIIVRAPQLGDLRPTASTSLPFGRASGGKVDWANSDSEEEDDSPDEE